MLRKAESLRTIKNSCVPKTSKLYFLENVSVSYNRVEVLKSISLTIERGEVLFVTGASGAGKTTLLRVLTGDVLPSSGRILRTNQIFHMAQVFQDLRLLGRQSAESNLMLSFDPSVYKNRDEFIYDMMEFSKILGVKDRLHLKISDANGGFQQKIAIIRALLSKPDVIILDEPSSNLDYENTRRIFEILNLYNIKKGLTMIWASHNRELIRSFTGRIIHLDQGRLIHSGHACFI